MTGSNEACDDKRSPNRPAQRASETSYEVIAPTITRLKDHPFTLIGLSDREKFHTGLLAHLLRRLSERDPEQFTRLIGLLWSGARAGEAFKCINNAIAAKADQRITVTVEEKYLDLAIKVDARVTLLAEMKLKTTLSKDQLKNIETKWRGEAKTLLGLFPEKVSKTSGFGRARFAYSISEFFDGVPIGSALFVDADEAALFRMWSDYLRNLDKVSSWFTRFDGKAVPNSKSFEEDLRALRLKGIFQWHRLEWIRRKFDDKRITIKHFNTNGGAGLDFYVGKSAGGFCKGLQWQWKSLKLFLIDENFPKHSGERDTALEKLATEFINEFGLERPNSQSQSGSNAKTAASPNLNRNGKFRSVTVENWDIFGNLAPCQGKLMNYLNFLSKRSSI